MSEHSAPKVDSPRGSVPVITRWDLDKTYLRTEFDTFRDLVKTAFEPAEEKRDVPGAARLLRDLASAEARVHILSGSPKQLRSRLTRKLSLDEVHFHELTLKPNLSNLLRLRFRALHDQLGYKLPNLLWARVRDQDALPEALEVLVGDDAEADAFVYSLYADICRGQVGRPELERVLGAGRVYADARKACLEAHEAVRSRDVVGRILIHLDRQSPPSDFRGYGMRVVPFYNYLQAAFVLAERGLIPMRTTLAVAIEFVRKHRFDSAALARSYLDLWRRGHVDGSSIQPLVDEIRTDELWSDLGEMCEALLEQPRPSQRPTLPNEFGLDYVALAHRYRRREKRARL
jgi:hypothetical protein